MKDKRQRSKQGAEDMANGNKLRKLAELIFKTKGAVVLTGAGMTTGPANNKRKTLGDYTSESIESDFGSFVDFCRMRINEVNEHHPNKGHNILSRWEDRGYVKRIITQNVDGYHTLAGSSDVVELYGNLWTIKCNACGVKNNSDVYKYDFAIICTCGGKNRPNVALPDEDLRAGVVARAIELSSESDLFIILGASLSEGLASELPQVAAKSGAMIALVGAEPAYDGDITINGPILEALIELDEIIRNEYEKQ